MKFTNDDEKKHHNGDGANRDQEYGNQLPEDVTRKYIHEIFKEATLGWAGRAEGPILGVLAMVVNTNLYTDLT